MLIKNAEKISLFLFIALITERWLVHFPRSTMTLDSLYYTLAASRFAEGNFSETLSGPWQPLIAWLSGILVFLGVSPISSVAFWSFLGGGVSVYLMTRLAGKWGGTRASLVTGVGLASDPRFCFEAASVRSDGFYLGVTAFTFALLITPFDQAGKITRKFIVSVAIVGAVLVSVRVAALPLALFVGLCLVWGYSLDVKSRIKIVLLYGGVVVLVLLPFCLLYYNRFGLFVPSLNFALNKFLRVVEWMHVDPEGFCRLYDGKNTMISDLQFLDPTAVTLPPVPVVDSSKIAAYQFSMVKNFFIVCFRMLNPIIWIGVGLGIWALWKNNNKKLLGFIFGFIVAACGAQIFSTIQTRFFLPMLGPLYVLAGIGFSLYLKNKMQWVALIIVGFNLTGSIDQMNPGFLLSGKFLQKPDLVGESIYKRYGPGRVIMAVESYPSLIEARARWKTIPCVETAAIENYAREKKVEFVIMSKPIEQKYGKTITDLVTKPGSILELDDETETEIAYRVKGP